MKEKIKESRFTYAAMRTLLQNCIAKRRKTYIAKCNGVDCKDCPFYERDGLCHEPLSNKDWKDIAIVEDVEMKEEIKGVLLENRFTYATMRILLQSCIAKDSEPYIAKCIGVDCMECPFNGRKSLCYARLSNEDWKDIAFKVVRYDR